MTSERWRQVERIYHAARAITPSERDAFLTQACEGDKAQTANIGNGAVAWSPDGRQLAVMGNSGAQASVVWIVKPDRPSPARKVLEFPIDVRLRGLAWSHDGNSLIVGQQRRTSGIVLLGLSP